MSDVDKRDKLADEPFAYRVSKEGKVFIYWQGRQVMILKDRPAQKFLVQVAQADTRQAQLVMAKLTGHFKHGNER